MKTNRLPLFLLVPALAALAACNTGSGVSYYIVASGLFSAPTGTACATPASNCTLLQGAMNCGETSTDLSQSTFAIYPGASSSVYLVGAASGLTLIGTSSGSSYTFNGQQIVSVSGSITTETDIRVALTLNGPGFTGTVTREVKVTGGDSSQDSDCTVTASLTGSQISEQEINATVDPAQSGLGNGGAVGGNNGGNGGNGNNGGNATATAGTATATGGTATATGGTATGSSWAGTYTASGSYSDEDNPNNDQTISGTETVSQSGSSVSINSFASPVESCTVSFTETSNFGSFSNVSCGNLQITSGEASYSAGNPAQITVEASGTDENTGDSFELEYTLTQ